MTLTRDSAPEEVQAAWADRLEANPRLARTGQLATPGGVKRCCLGLLCDMAVEAGVIDGYCASGSIPPLVVQRWVGLRSLSGRFTGAAVSSSLLRLNDKPTAREPFARRKREPAWVTISRVIRERPDGLFVDGETAND